MVDPVSSKAVAGVASPEAGGIDGPKQGKGPDGASFKDVMEGKETDGAQDPSQVGEVDGARQVDAAQKVEGPDKAMEARLDNFVKGVMGDEKNLDRMMSRAMGGAELNNTELLELQGLMYSYGQKVDLASKVVSKATDGMKQMMNTQV